MHIKAQGILLSKIKYGESSFIINVFTESSGVIKGLVKGVSAKNRYMLELGNIISIEKRNHSNEKLGFITYELKESFLYSIFNDHARLQALLSICSLLDSHMTSVDTDADFYYLTKNLIIVLSEENYLENYIQWEVELLKIIGLGLDLTKCVLSGSTNNLYYLSPKTGKSVTKEIGDSYGKLTDKLFVIPSFLLQKNPYLKHNTADISAGFKITTWFLNKFSLEYNKNIPQVRSLLLQNIEH